MNQAIIIQSAPFKGDNESYGSDDPIDVQDDIQTVKSIRFEGRKLERLKIFLRGSQFYKIVEMNELQSSVTHIWSDLPHAGDLHDMERFRIFTLEAESGLETSQVMEFGTVTNYQAMMSSLYEDMGYEFYAFFKKLITPTCPDSLNRIGLYGMYEQLVFYEYIYSSPIYSLIDKIRWMIDNRYKQLIDLLDDHYLEVWSQRMDHTSLDEYVSLGFEYKLMEGYIGHKGRFDELADMIDLHSQVIPFDSHKWNERFELNDRIGLIGFIPLVLNYNMAKNIDLFLNANRSTIRKIQRFVGKVSRDSEFKSRTDIFADYVLTNFIMRLVEHGYSTLLGWSDATQADIIYRWLVYASRVIESSNCRYALISRSDQTKTFVSKYLFFQYTSDINMRYIEGSLTYVNMDFKSMIHILMRDNIEMFKIITRNCTFETIDPILLAYYPEQILNHIMSRTGKSIIDLVRSMRSDLDIDIHTLAMIPYRTVKLADIVLKYGFTRSTRKNVKIENLISGRVDMMNEDIITLHEIEEVDHYIRDTNSESLGIDRIINALFFESGEPMESRKYFDNLGNVSIMGILSYLYLKNNYDSTPIRNYISYLISRADFDRISPDLNDMYDNLLFLKVHRGYRNAFSDFVNLRNGFLKENNADPDDEIKLQSRCGDPKRYGIYIEGNCDSDSDNSVSDNSVSDNSVSDSDGSSDFSEDSLCESFDTSSASDLDSDDDLSLY